LLIVKDLKYQLMKKLYSVILCIFIFTISCDKERINENFQDNTGITNINGKWKVVSYENFEKGTITVKTDVDSWNGLDVILTFLDDSIWGYCTTNNMRGKYSLSGRNIHIITYGGTKIAQPEWGNLFTKVIYDLESFEVNEHQLRFFYDNSEKSVTLSRE
jgi:hypothetical protein